MFISINVLFSIKGKWGKKTQINSPILSLLITPLGIKQFSYIYSENYAGLNVNFINISNINNNRIRNNCAF